jgi:hypothetical protein
MATQAQYDCFKDVFDREAERHELLIDRGKTFLSVITLYMGLLGVAVDKTVPRITESPVAIVFYIASLFGFMSALSLIVFALGIYQYVYPTDPIGVINEFGSAPPTDADFFDGRIVELAAAFQTNRAATERRANFLKYATWCMLAGIVCQAFVLSSLLFSQPPSGAHDGKQAIRRSSATAATAADCAARNRNALRSANAEPGETETATATTAARAKAGAATAHSIAEIAASNHS